MSNRRIERFIRIEAIYKKKFKKRLIYLKCQNIRTNAGRHLYFMYSLKNTVFFPKKHSKMLKYIFLGRTKLSDNENNVKISFQWRSAEGG